MTSPDADFLVLPFSPEELDLVLSFVNVKSSPGLDNIDYFIIKKFFNLDRVFLLRIFNSIFLSRTFPSDWRNYLVFFIPKANKEKFRPISLSSCLCKTIERMITNRLNWWLEFHNKLPNSQFGFRKQKSCMDNLSLLYTDMIKGFQKKNMVPAVFLDIQSAYDNVLPDILINKLLELGVPPNTKICF